MDRRRRPGRIDDSDPAVVAQWLRALYESHVLYSGLLDRDGRLLEANHLAIEGCGFVRSETLGRPFSDGGWWSPDPGLAATIRGWCTGAVETGRSLRAVCRYFRGDGTTGMVEFTLDPIVERTAASGSCSSSPTWPGTAPTPPLHGAAPQRAADDRRRAGRSGRGAGRANHVAVATSVAEGPLATCCGAALYRAGATLRWAVAGHMPPVVRPRPVPPTGSRGGPAALSASTRTPPTSPTR